MRKEDMILISVDDHIVEPPETFLNHVSAKYKDTCPRIISTDESDLWLFDGHICGTIGSGAVSGRSKEERCREPFKFSHMRKGCYNVHARIDDMNANGVLSSLNFGTLVGFAGETFLRGKDKEEMAAYVRAYNDWHKYEWCDPYPGRFIPAGILPLKDVNDAVTEAKRLIANGFKAICFPENCATLGLPSIHTGAWDPLFKVVSEAGVPFVIHIGTGGGFRYPSMDSPADVAIATMNITLADCVADFLFSDLPNKFPNLVIALSEGYMGWMPFFKERCDYVYEFHRFWTGADFGDKKPSDLIRKHFRLCFTEDPTGVKNRHDIGIETISWESDYPHADSTWPESVDRLWPSLKDLPDDEIDLITWKNAIEVYKFDPFASVPKSEATVAKLQDRARHIDTRPVKGLGGYKPEMDLLKGKLTAGDMKKLAEDMGWARKP